ncbi:hypothetical protein CYMTET_38021 [Cymbomonas tetramitiformis]|uniref:Uncharacterized protein n=1 Tax=Cymbomonas tetramitiformis TaxID=36881 RepID=A0AAE0F5D4_9CHLO|nr:hypothetical protein CYMTET_38021 [Cymbomonas tetramitiformis]
MEDSDDAAGVTDRWRRNNLVGGFGTNGNLANHDMDDILAVDHQYPLNHLSECSLMDGIMACGAMLCGQLPSPADGAYWEEANENVDIIVEDVMEGLKGTHIVADEEMNTPTEDGLAVPDFLFQELSLRVDMEPQVRLATELVEEMPLCWSEPNLATPAFTLCAPEEAVWYFMDMKRRQKWTDEHFNTFLKVLKLLLGGDNPHAKRVNEHPVVGGRLLRETSNKNPEKPGMVRSGMAVEYGEDDGQAKKHDKQ